MSSVFFVTGSSRGLGRQIVEQALAAGHRVVATARNPHALEDLARRDGNRIHVEQLDVTDPVAAQDKFKKKHDLGIPLLSDEAHKMLEAYGAWGKKSMYGKSFMGIIRATFLIDADGRIARIGPKVKVDGHAAEVLAAAKLLPR